MVESKPHSSEYGKAVEDKLTASYYLPLLFVVFGMSSWMSVNTLWVEMPLLAAILPESWAIASYVTIVIQFGNIGPFLVSIVRKKVRYAPLIYLILAWLIATTLALAFVFDITTIIAGEEHSVAFFVAVFILALCDCTSNVTFLPYMANFNPRFLVYFFVGQGLSGLVPSILGLAQGSGSFDCVLSNSSANGTNSTVYNPVYLPARFSFEIFLFVNTGIVVMSLLCFILIEVTRRHLKSKAIQESKVQSGIPSTMTDHLTPISDIIHVPQLDPFSHHGKQATTAFVTESSETVQNDQYAEDVLTEDTPVLTGRSATLPTVYDAVDSRPLGSVFQDGERLVAARRDRTPFKRKTYSQKDFLVEYFLNGFFCFFINGFLPALQSYSSMPYGQLVFSLVASLWVAAVPLGSWLTMCLKVNRLRTIGIIGAVGVVPIAYVVTLAGLCPWVPLSSDPGGYFLVVASWFTINSLFVFSRVSVAQRVQKGGHKALFWFGFSTQAASLLGAIVAFLLVFFSAFQNPILC